MFKHALAMFFIMAALSGCDSATYVSGDTQVPVVGATGPQGIQGPQGAPGPAGPSGAAGATGPSGAKGATGATGAAGLNGMAGIQGPQGVQGPAGPQGPAGYSIAFKAVPATDAQCPYGGTTLELWVDVNRNGAYDAGTDTGFAQVPICNQDRD